MPVTSRRRGFTLIELILGIVVFAIAITLITTLIVPQAQRGVDPILQVRATELARSLFAEISSKNYDENSSPGGNQVPCNKDLNGDGTLDASDDELACSVTLGPDEANREDYDDVDDYNGLRLDDTSFTNTLGEAITFDGQPLYQGFSADVTVSYAGDYTSPAPDPTKLQSAKRIDIMVTTPTGEQISFVRYRSNY